MTALRFPRVLATNRGKKVNQRYASVFVSKVMPRQEDTRQKVVGSNPSDFIRFLSTKYVEVPLFNHLAWSLLIRHARDYNVLSLVLMWQMYPELK